MEKNIPTTVEEVLNTTEFPNSFKLYIPKDTEMYDITKIIKHFKDLNLYTEMIYDTNGFLFRVFKSYTTLDTNKIKKLDKTFENKVEDSIGLVDQIDETKEFLLVVFTPDSNKYRRKINDTLWIERGSILYDMLIKCLSEYKNKLKIFGGNN